MSCYMVFNSWSGDDSADAIEKMARVFRMEEDQASQILDDLETGETWQFEHQISDKQSEIAEGYLQGLGFDLERIPIMVDEEDMEFDDDMDESAGKKKGFFGKLFGVFFKKK